MACDLASERAVEHGKECAAATGKWSLEGLPEAVG
jgi:hypothetical protein